MFEEEEEDAGAMSIRQLLLHLARSKLHQSKMTIFSEPLQRISSISFVFYDPKPNRKLASNLVSCSIIFFLNSQFYSRKKIYIHDLAREKIDGIAQSKNDFYFLTKN